jgi:voltage-gated potassium channel
MDPFRTLLPATVLLLLITALGVIGYMVIEPWPLLDAAYMVVITLFTIGFREVRPLSPVGRVFTMALAIMGVGTAVYAAGRAVELIVEGEMSGYRHRRRMAKKVTEMKNHYIICGFGRVGHQVAEALKASKARFLVVDTKPETALELEPLGVPSIAGDATSNDALVAAGIERAKALIACSDSDVANVYITLSARSLNPNIYIVARAGLRDTEKKLLIAGANRVISPYFMAGMRMAALATRPVITDFLDLVSHGGQLEFNLHEISISGSCPLAGRTIKEANIREQSGAVVLAIRRADGTFDLQPRASSLIQKQDVLVVIGTDQQISALLEMVGE